MMVKNLMVEISNLYVDTAERLKKSDAYYAKEEEKLRKRLLEIDVQRQKLKILIAYHTEHSEKDFHCGVDCSACDKYDECEKYYNDMKLLLEKNCTARPPKFIW